MDRREQIAKLKHLITYARWVIVALLLLVLIFDIIGFIVKWSQFALHPAKIIDSYPDLTDDIFSILVIYEIFDLLYTLSPTRLMDVVLLTIARKVVLSPGHAGLMQYVVAFAILLVIRLAWYRFTKQHDPV
ncbi:hypothetical protein NZD89_19960 [Alicyclobacillus fastidiosus]|uniref:Protein PsiE n=1 Tax=Alicyclobacillus fastidiosus TaxID=392011 RepID=A0ABY6ZEL5_9BACL|nr:hypothetical protein [Alicyclobacillus fastidiosus]WAH40571.1 hypothetical protein NZD89_19960 [Alicyclobacillus fastidiosus]GMA62006.1 hypothetical protein GCM10025859_24460 [Alicyclobacillus fastidiosus]